MNTRSLRWCAVVAVAVTLACRSGAQGPPDWSRPTEPFRIVGNVYWVGTHDLSSYLITSSEGHIVINTGLADSVSQIRANIERLGFRVSDVKILSATHAHWDHVAGLAALKKMTGAHVHMSAPDADVLESGGKSDFRWGTDPQAWFDPVAVDRRLMDGDTISLGTNSLTLHIHAGHSKGASSFTFTVREGARDYRVGIINMGSINPGVRVSGMPGFSDIGDAYARTFAAQKAMVLDVFLSSHASQFGLHQKRKQGDAYNPDRFVDPKGFRAAVDELEASFRKQLAAERQQQSNGSRERSGIMRPATSRSFTSRRAPGESSRPSTNGDCSFRSAGTAERSSWNRNRSTAISGCSRSRATVLARRTKARLGDALIAQSCLDHRLPLLTRDRDFMAFADAAGLDLVVGR